MDRTDAASGREGRPGMRRVGFAVVVLVGFVVAGAAGGVLLAAVDVIPLSDETFEAVPRWIVGMAALAFVLAGLTTVSAVLPVPRTRQVLGGAALLMFLTTLALVLSWLTVYAGARVYVRVGGFRIPLPSELNEERVVLGFSAVFLSVFAGAAWIGAIRLVWRPRPPTADK